MDEREYLLTTMELCEKLSVSRDWVNKHLRTLGSAPNFIGDGSRIRAVFYRESDVVKWLNDHATCSAQTRVVSLRDYASAEKIEIVSSMARKSLEEKKCPANLIDIYVFEYTIDKLLPREVSEEAERVDSRKRGDLPWVPASWKIKSLDELRTIKDLADGGSPELGYRKAFLFGMIRIEVDGRRWFVRPEENIDPEWCFVMPYKQR